DRRGRGQPDRHRHRRWRIRICLDPLHPGGDHAGDRQGRRSREPGGGHAGEVRGGAHEGDDMTEEGSFAPIDEAVEELRQGRIVIVVDDADRENEGDFVMAAEKVTPEAINFMATHGRGIICMPCEGSRLEELRIPLMVAGKEGSQETAFAVSIDARGSTTTGTSAY